MSYLLDTHVVLSAAIKPQELPRNIEQLLSTANEPLLISAASAWEIATKVRIGKLPEAEHFERNFMQYVAMSDYELLPITPEDALAAGRLRGKHRDPFDRMLVAQSLAMNLALISADTKLDEFNVRRIW